MVLLLIIPKKSKIFVNQKIYLGFKKFNLKDLKLTFLLCIKPNGKKNIKETGWKENWMNHTMELIRTVLPFIILLLQIYILAKII